MKKNAAKPVMPTKLDEMIDMAVDEYGKALATATENIVGAAAFHLREAAMSASGKAKEALKQKLKNVTKSCRK